MAKILARFRKPRGGIEQVRDFLREAVNFFVCVICGLTLIFLATFVTTSLLVNIASLMGWGDEVMAGLMAVGVCSLFVYFPLTLLFLDKLDGSLSKENLGVVKEKIKRKISERQIKAARAERVSGSLSLSESLGSGNLSFAEKQGALSLAKKMGGSS